MPSALTFNVVVRYELKYLTNYIIMCICMYSLTGAYKILFNNVTKIWKDDKKDWGDAIEIYDWAR